MELKPTLAAWLVLARNGLERQLLTRSSALLFVVGKLFNLVFSIVIIASIFRTVPVIAGYTIREALVFLLVYQLVDSTSQSLFRAVYMFRPALTRGDFDLDLLRPLPSFFRPLLAFPDFLDFPPILVTVFALGFVTWHYHISVTPVSLMLFGFMFCNSLLLAFAFHLLTAAFAILTMEVDNVIWIYRNLTRAGRVPLEVYPTHFRLFLTIVVPIFILTNVPAKVFLGLLDFGILLVIGLLTGLAVYLALRFWFWALGRYTSAGS